MADTWREFLLDLVELGGVIVVLGAGVIISLRKAFRYTDAFERPEPQSALYTAVRPKLQ